MREEEESSNKILIILNFLIFKISFYSSVTITD